MNKVIPWLLVGVNPLSGNVPLNEKRSHLHQEEWFIDIHTRNHIFYIVSWSIFESWNFGVQNRGFYLRLEG
jgi:hypothetical protein